MQSEESNRLRDTRPGDTEVRSNPGEGGAWWDVVSPASRLSEEQPYDLC